MLRVIGGVLSGRKFETSKLARTHPMGDRVKMGLFNALGDIEGLSVLDAFAGNGALSFESISRGAASAMAIELDPRVFKVLKANAAQLGLEDQVKTIRANCSGWSDHNPDARFDLVFCDPPYDAVKPAPLEKMARHVKPGGVIVFSLPPRSGFTLPSSIFHLLSSKSYGDAQLVFYRKIA